MMGDNGGGGDIPDSWVNKIRGQGERVWGRRRRTVAKYHQKWDMRVVWCGGQGSKGKGEVKFGEKVPPNRGVEQDKERMCEG
jgi:hypothetical protein